MTDTISVDALRDQVNAISSHYDALFAGKPRATRDPEVLDGLITDLSELIKLGESLGQDAHEPLEVAQSNLQLYKEELARIHQARAEGPHVLEAADLATWANFVFDEYSRHFAGQNRATRDMGRMREMVLELESLQDDMASLLESHGLDSVREDLQTVRDNLKLYRDELQKIAEARKSGTRDDRVSVLASAANDQFTVYRNLFAGKGRTTRRPSLLERVLKNLEGILNEMRDLNSKSTTRNPTNTQNISIVQDNMKLYRQELVEIARARQQASREDLAEMLGGAANDVMAQYREHFAGQNRATRDLDMIRAMCDELYEIAIQMREIQDDEPGLEVNTKNLRIVMDTLALYQREYRNIREAKGLT